VQSQNPGFGVVIEAGSSVSFVACPPLLLAVDEPETVTLFAIGLALLVLVIWWQRRYA